MTRQLVLYETTVEKVGRDGPFTELQGRAVPYGVWTNRGIFMESVRHGAFDKSLDENGLSIPLHLFHDSDSYPIGVATAWDRKRDALYGVWRLDGGEEAQRAATLAHDGLLGYMSVGHSPIRNEWEFVSPEEWNP